MVLAWLAVEWPPSWLALAGPFLTLLEQIVMDTISGYVGSFSKEGRSLVGEPLTIESSLMSGCH